MVEDILAAGKREQGWRLEEPKLYTRALLKMCSGVATWFKPEGELTIAQIADAYADLLCNGLLPR